MKFETPKIVINAFSENIVTGASEIENSQTVSKVRDILREGTNNVNVNNILTFTFDQ